MPFTALLRYIGVGLFVIGWFWLIVTIGMGLFMFPSFGLGMIGALPQPAGFIVSGGILYQLCRLNEQKSLSDEAMRLLLIELGQAASRARDDEPSEPS